MPGALVSIGARVAVVHKTFKSYVPDYMQRMGVLFSFAT